jgi:excisionase family DNA binding protein
MSPTAPHRTTALTAQDIAALPAAPDLRTTCRALGISRSKGYELLAAGEFPLEGFKVGSLWRFRLTDLAAFLGLPSPGGAHTAHTPFATSDGSQASGVQIRQDRAG